MSYSLAVLDPFNPKAEGARVPDSYAFPTEAITFRSKYNVNCSDTFNQNWFDQVYKASVIDFLTEPTAQASTADTAFNKDATRTSLSLTTPIVQPGGWKSTWNQLSSYGWVPTSTAQLKANNEGTGAYKWSKYRVVGGGVRLRSQLIPDKATGYLSFYSTETTDIDYSTELFEATDFTVNENRARLALHTGRPYVKGTTPEAADSNRQKFSVVLNETMSEEPTGEVLDALSFNSKGCQMSFRPMTAQAYEWRNMTSAPKYDVVAAGVDTIPFVPDKFNTEGTASTTLGFNDATTGSLTDFDEGFYKCGGWNTLCVKGSQLPTAMGGNEECPVIMPVMIVEVILHIEFISSDIGVTSFAKTMAHNQGLLDAVAYKAAIMPMYRTLFAGSVSTANRKIRQRGGY